MIIRNNMTSNDVQKQIASMSKFKRGFNQTPKSINGNFNKVSSKGNPNNSVDIDLNKKIQAMRNISRFK